MTAATPFLDQAQGHRRGVTGLLGDLIHTPSLSSEEEAVVTLLTERMTTLGYDEVRVDGFGSVIGRIGSGPIVVVYDSHIDTVGVGSLSEWRTDPFEPVIDGDRESGVMHGRGASDDKGGMAAMVYGGALYKQMGPSDAVTLYVVGSVQEEDCDGLALEHLLLHTLPRPDLVVLGEATNLDVFRGNRGRIEVLVRTRGSSCHASAPERGNNPVYALAPLIADIERLNQRLGHDDFLGAGTVALTKIECETPSLNAVPSTASIYLDRRLTAGEDPVSALDAIRELPAVRAAGAEVSLLTYERTSFTGLRLGQEKSFATWVLPEDHLGVQAGIRAGVTALDRRPATGHWVFSTNGVASMGKLGIPTIGFGPANEIHAHTTADQCPIEDLVQAIAWYAAFPAEYARTHTAGTTR
ncbi:MAG TPA: YgeY family selenium metabolism-linked hydrolase [Candidatus Dormibacteraeota bacterium]|nr:YgeY family selenium metabolism-linked hydrolase [Candidatus Dormibacteraeota bacterium]